MDNDDTTSQQLDTRPVAEEEHAEFHGNTPAAWTAVVIVLVAFTLGAIAMVIGPNWPLFWVSVGVAVVGALVGKILQVLGFGKPAEQRAGE